ncbi:hypothetical protein FA15DRAFT_672164 [Coprinopsis marcescibilis]|uniref:Uncharacterized protein n=1 Tax=Coprinopsis marcescibilis TaxID=230819 RepID=A0A5C3KP86_COPMA|nr:hypothetical protein FA15DRAFT_672164 [Coprinopsis marcescibilis]
MATRSQSQSVWSSVVNAIQNRLKPHRAEAIQRIRFNSLCLTIFIILASLLPLPSILSAVRTCLQPKGDLEKWSQEWIYRWICVSEVTALTIFLFNIFESLYALNYPPPPLPPTPHKSLKHKPSAPHATSTPQKPFRVLSPNSSPQPQKPFTFSPSASLASFTASGQGYPPSPISTPSRVLQYSALSSSANGGFNSSTSTSGYTPSPSVSVYRGMNLNNSVGRALDGSYLGRMLQPDEEEEEE